MKIEHLNSQSNTPATPSSAYETALTRPSGIEAFSLNHIAALPANELPEWVRANCDQLLHALEARLLGPLAPDDVDTCLEMLLHLVSECRPALSEQQLRRAVSLIYSQVHWFPPVRSTVWHRRIKALNLYPWLSRDGINAELEIRSRNGEPMDSLLALRVWQELDQLQFPDAPVDELAPAEFVANFSRLWPKGMVIEWPSAKKHFSHLAQHPYVTRRIQGSDHYHFGNIPDFFADPSPFNPLVELVRNSLLKPFVAVGGSRMQEPPATTQQPKGITISQLLDLSAWCRNSVISTLLHDNQSRLLHTEEVNSAIGSSGASGFTMDVADFDDDDVVATETEMRIEFWFALNGESDNPFSSADVTIDGTATAVIGVDGSISFVDVVIDDEDFSDEDYYADDDDE